MSASSSINGHLTRPKVSLTMIVKDAAVTLPACLESVASLGLELVILDLGSTDATVKIAEDHGAQVFRFAFADDYAAARNAALKHATGDWIFYMDGDEWLDEANRAKLQDFLANLPQENVAFSMKCLHLPHEESERPTAVDQIRLFRNHPALEWRYRVFEQILPSLRSIGADVRFSDVVIQRRCTDAAARQRNNERTLRLLALENEDRPDDSFTLFNFGLIHHELGQHKEALPYLQRSHCAQAIRLDRPDATTARPVRCGIDDVSGGPSSLSQRR